MIFNHSEKDYQDLQKTNWKNINYLNGKIEQLEKELKEAKAKLTANRFIFRTTVRNEYLDKIGKLENENIELKQTIDDFKVQCGKSCEQLSEIKYLNRGEVEKIFKTEIFKDDEWNWLNNYYKPRYANAVTAICNLACKIDKDKIIAMFEYAISVLNNELILQKADYYSFSEKKNQDHCIKNQIELEQSISILEKAGETSQK